MLPPDAPDARAYQYLLKCRTEFCRLPLVGITKAQGYVPQRGVDPLDIQTGIAAGGLPTLAVICPNCRQTLTVELRRRKPGRH